MPGLVQLVTAISNDVVSKMAALGLPPLTDGGIVLGKSKGSENSFPPRIIFIPRSSRFEPRSSATNFQPINVKNSQAPGSGVRSYTMTAYGSGYSGTPTVTIGPPDVAGGVQATASAVVTTNGAISKLVPTLTGSGYLNAPTVTIVGTGSGAGASANLAPPPQALAVTQTRSLLTEVVQFEVHCWGISQAFVGGGITAASNTSPIVITTASAHGIQPGNSVTISGVVGNTAANGTFGVTVIGSTQTSTQFSLTGSIGNGAYVSGGVVGVLSPDANADFDATQALYQQVIASTHLIAPGVYKVLGGKWVDAMPSATVVDVVGHDFIFGLELATPVLDQALQFANPQVQANPTNYIIPFGGGTPEQGSSG